MILSKHEMELFPLFPDLGSKTSLKKDLPFLLRGAFKKKKLRNFGHVAKFLDPPPPGYSFYNRF